MGFWSRSFTWWDGDTWGTRLFTWLNGNEVGRDERGNIYYESKGKRPRRWVIYPADNDASRVPPGWAMWLRGTIEGLPDESLPARRNFELPAEPNATGTMAAFRPDGSLGSGRIRPSATGDYQPWLPE